MCDQASNIKTALRKTETIADLESGSITCIDHKLNMALERTVSKQPETKAAIDACRTISARVHHSPLAEGVLKKKCLEMNGNIFNFLSRYEYENLQLNVKFLQIFSKFCKSLRFHAKFFAKFYFIFCFSTLQKDQCSLCYQMELCLDDAPRHRPSPTCAVCSPG